jgi:hypothetical protein
MRPPQLPTVCRFAAAATNATVTDMCSIPELGVFVIGCSDGVIAVWSRLGSCLGVFGAKPGTPWPLLKELFQGKPKEYQRSRRDSQHELSVPMSGLTVSSSERRSSTITGAVAHAHDGSAAVVAFAQSLRDETATEDAELAAVAAAAAAASKVDVDEVDVRYAVLNPAYDPPSLQHNAARLRDFRIFTQPHQRGGHAQSSAPVASPSSSATSRSTKSALVLSPAVATLTSYTQSTAQQQRRRRGAKGNAAQRHEHVRATTATVLPLVSGMSTINSPGGGGGGGGGINGSRRNNASPRSARRDGKKRDESLTLSSSLTHLEAILKQRTLRAKGDKSSKGDAGDSAGGGRRSRRRSSRGDISPGG